MCLRAQGAERHGAGHETAHDGKLRLDLVNRERWPRGPDRKQVTQECRRLPINQSVQLLPAGGSVGACAIAVGTVSRRLPGRSAHCLHGANNRRLPCVTLRDVTLSEPRGTGVGQIVSGSPADPAGTCSSLNPGEAVAGQQPGASDEALRDHFLLETQDVKQLRAAIAVHSGDAALGHHFGEPRIQRMQIIFFALLRLHELRRGQRQPGTNRPGAVSDEHGDVVDVPCIAGFDGDPGECPQSAATSASCTAPVAIAIGIGQKSAATARSVSSRMRAPAATAATPAARSGLMRQAAIRNRRKYIAII